jgi:hypothetical protein
MRHLRTYEVAGYADEMLSNSAEPREFRDTAQRAFPGSLCNASVSVADWLVPLVDMNYGVRTFDVTVEGEQVFIPVRIHFRSEPQQHHLEPERSGPMADCLLSRSTDGYLRHSALRRIVSLNQPWSVPYVVFLLGEYVVEIAEEIQRMLPNMDVALIREFLRANPRFHALINARCASYWNCYYRWRFPEFSAYPAAIVLRAVETRA